MAGAWNQSGFVTLGGTDISGSVATNNFAFGAPKVLTRLSVWLSDDTSNDNGILDSFSGTLGWAIYSDNGGKPGTLLFSGTDAAPLLTDTGTQSGSGGDIVKADIDLGALALGVGNYWVAIHEGAWGSADDGSSVHWVWSSTNISQGVAQGTPVSAPTSWTAENLGHDSAFAFTANAKWSQDAPSAAGGADISQTSVGDNFTLAQRSLIAGATVWLTDGIANDNGILDSFSGTLGWAIYSSVGGKPGQILWSSVSNTVSITDTGLQSAGGADIARVDFTFGPFNADLPAGDYFLVVREGNWNTPHDASPIFWTFDGASVGTKAMVETVVGGVSSWAETSADTSFQLWSAVVATTWDNAETDEDHAVTIDVQANDLFDTDHAITAVSTPVLGTATIDDKGTPGNTNDDRVIYTPLPNYSGSVSFQYTVTSGNISSTGMVTVKINAANDAPTGANLAGDVVTWNQGGGGVRVDAGLNAALADIDSANFGGGMLTVSIGAGGVAGQDQLYFASDDILKLVGADVYVRGINIGSVVGSGGSLTFGLSNLATPDLLAVALQHLTYVNSGGTAPTGGTRSISYVLTDGDGVAHGGSDTLSWTSSVNVIDLDETGIANADSRALYEGQMVNIAVLANDSAANGPLQVMQIEGFAITAGQPLTLASGAVVTLLANGKLLYDPHGAFNWLTSAATGAATGAVSSYIDRFSYTLADGSSALVSVTVNGLDNPDGTLSGDAGNNSLTGTGGADTFLLQHGGTDHASGGAGGDMFYFGATLGAGDTVDGGEGTDTLLLQGNYGNAGTYFQLGAGMLDNIEMLVLMTGADARYGALAGYDRYYLKLADAAVAAGATLTVQGSKLGAFESLYFDGSAETDAHLRLVGGARDDYLRGGNQSDWIMGGTGNDLMRGGGGADVFYFRAGDSLGDTISDYRPEDIIDLSAIDANTGTAGDDAFAFIGSAGFHHVPGELRAVLDDTSWQWQIEADTNGDGQADFVLFVNVATFAQDTPHFTL